AQPRDRVAQLIRALEVAPRTRLDARGHQALDLGRRTFRRSAAAEEPEHARQLHELVHARHERAGRRSRGTAVARIGQRPHQVEERGERLRRVEVVVHRPLEAWAELGEGRRQRGRGGGAADGGGVTQEAREPVEGPGGLFDALLGPFDHVAIVRAEHPEPERVGIVALDDLADVQRVAERLRHLLLAHVDHAVVRPVAGERPAGARLGLGDLALVVWKDQVLAATVEVERLSEIFHGHRRTLDVPARTSGTPRAVPRWLARLRAFPEREITRIALALVDLDARAGEELVEVLPGEPAVGREATDLEVHVAVDGVGVTG